MSVSLTREEMRALRLLAKGPAYELESRPLRNVGRLRALGLAAITSRYQTPRHGPGRRIDITKEGLSALSVSDGSPEGVKTQSGLIEDDSEEGGHSHV